MHPKVLSAEAWKTVQHLASAGLLESWILAGGTGLALQFGHRYSEDLDLFRAKDFDAVRLVDDIARLGQLAVQDRSEGTLHASLEGLRLSFLRAQAPFLFPGTPYRGLVVADPRDIAVLKVIAIGGRGSRKDFVDLCFYLRGGGSLEAIFQMLGRRFRGVDYNEYHLLKSLAYFDDAEGEPMPRMIRQVTWDDVKATIVAEVKRLS
jgi:hypothetical protein